MYNLANDYFCTQASEHCQGKLKLWQLMSDQLWSLILPSFQSYSAIFLYFHDQQLPLPTVGISAKILSFIPLYEDNSYFTEKIKLKNLTFPQIFCLNTYQFIHHSTQPFFVFSHLREYNFLCSKVAFLILFNSIIIILIIVSVYHLLGAYYVSVIDLSPYLY